MSAEASTKMPIFEIEDNYVPKGWVVGVNHETHVALVRDDNARINISAHPMPEYTDEDGWFALARPGTKQVIAEGVDLVTVVEKMQEAAATWDETDGYQWDWEDSLRDKYGNEVNGGEASYTAGDVDSNAGENASSQDGEPQQESLMDYL